MYKCSKKRLLNYIRRNPGLTTTQLCTLLRPDQTHYTKCSFASRLKKLAEKGEVIRNKSTGACSDSFSIPLLSSENRRSNYIDCGNNTNKKYRGLT